MTIATPTPVAAASGMSMRSFERFHCSRQNRPVTLTAVT
jgi:hypothetical protein